MNDSEITVEIEDDDEEKLEGPYLRFVQAMGNDLDAIVSKCIVLDWSREDFLDMCGSAYDWLTHWHQIEVERHQAAKEKH